MEAASAKLKAYEDAMACRRNYAKQPGTSQSVAYTLNRKLESLSVTARRIRDNTPYCTVKKMHLSGGDAGMADRSRRVH
ncbi:MAG: hypothetical protein RSD57_03605 [Comamonas sp.]